MDDAPRPQHLNVYLCPECSGGVMLEPTSQPGGYRLLASDEIVEGAYITQADAQACIDRHAVAHAELMAQRAAEADEAKARRKASWETQPGALFGGATLPHDWHGVPNE